MKVYAISDLHLSFGTDKPMDVFGSHWKGHWDRIKEDWYSKVSEDDIVLIAGDLSWAINYDEAKKDLFEICSLPGHKVLSRGNHDYWHSSLKKTKELLFNRTEYVQNNAVVIGDYAFCGTRGWMQKDPSYTEEDEKIYQRELIRLELSLKEGAKTGKEIIGMIHYPPFEQDISGSPFTDMFKAYGVRTVIFGHIHGLEPGKSQFGDITLDDTRYLLTSCDYLDFRLMRII